MKKTLVLAALVWSGLAVAQPIRSKDYHQEVLRTGDSAYYQNKKVMVLGKSPSGQFSVKTSSTFGLASTFSNIKREELAVTSGCLQGHCVNDRVLDIATGKELSIVGLGFDRTFVTEEAGLGSKVASGVKRGEIARTHGCSVTYLINICVGDTVMTPENRYAQVVGLQDNYLVILKFEKALGLFSKTESNVNPHKLVIVK